MMTAISDIGVDLIRKLILNPVPASVYHHLSINQNKTFIKADIFPFIKSPLPPCCDLYHQGRLSFPSFPCFPSVLNSS